MAQPQKRQVSFTKTTVALISVIGGLIAIGQPIISGIYSRGQAAQELKNHFDQDAQSMKAVRDAVGELRGQVEAMQERQSKMDGELSLLLIFDGQGDKPKGK